MLKYYISLLLMYHDEADRTLLVLRYLILNALLTDL
jgi:hypothetical protein